MPLGIDPISTYPSWSGRHSDQSKNRRRPPDVPQPGPFHINGIQYYLAGRHAFRSGHGQDVSAFLFHLGFELMFKATVVSNLFRRYDGHAGQQTAPPPSARHQTLSTLSFCPSRELRLTDHNLVVAWMGSKAQHQGVDPRARFDSVVSALDRWRRLRYPGDCGFVDYYITSSHEDKVGSECNWS